MLEPILMLTFLNCFFMFSTTVTTCALWWQNKRKTKRPCGQRFAKPPDVRPTKKSPGPSEEFFCHAKNCPKFRDNPKTSGTNQKMLKAGGVQERRNLPRKESPAKQKNICDKKVGIQELEIHHSKENTDTGLMVQSIMKSANEAEYHTQELSHTEKLASTEEITRPTTQCSSSSPPPSRDNKSGAVVMEVSTIQNFVQVFDTDHPNRTEASDYVNCKFSNAKNTQSTCISNKNQEK